MKRWRIGCCTRVVSSRPLIFRWGSMAVTTIDHWPCLNPFLPPSDWIERVRRRRRRRNWLAWWVRGAVRSIPMMDEPLQCKQTQQQFTLLCLHLFLIAFSLLQFLSARLSVDSTAREETMTASYVFVCVAFRHQLIGLVTSRQALIFFFSSSLKKNE